MGGPPRIVASEVLTLFPTFVWKAQLAPEVSGPLNAAITWKLDELRSGLPPLAPGHGWQSGQTLHELLALRELVGGIDAVTATVLRFLHVGYDAFEITGCWANVSAPGAAHRMHTHPNNFLSGVYYVEVWEGADTINFHDPRGQAGIIRPPVTELTEENTDMVVVRVSNGTLLLFPAWLPHSVEANRSDRPRVSVSFNVMFSAFTEHLSKPLW